MIVAVDAQRVPAERPPFRAERLEADRIRHPPERLELVVIDDSTKVREPVMPGEHRRFPDRPLVAFAVAKDDEHALISAEALEVERHPCADPETVA